MLTGGGPSRTGPAVTGHPSPRGPAVTDHPSPRGPAVTLCVGGRRVRVGDGDVLGVGGEARVFRVDDTAVKVFHDASGLALRLAKVRRFASLALPPEVVAPREIVTDDAGTPVGYAMALVPAAEEVARLGQRSWRERV